MKKMSNNFLTAVPPGSSRPKKGQSLVEVLVALCVLGLVIPSSLEALGTVFSAEIRIHQWARKASYAEWWFDRLEVPVSQSVIDAAPRTNDSGAVRFDWETEFCEYGALRVTLHVSNGTGFDVPFTLSRIY
jgi:hypothetical protein